MRRTVPHMKIEPGARVFDANSDEELGHVIDPGGQARVGRDVAHVQIVPEFSDRKLFVHRGRRRSKDYAPPVAPGTQVPGIIVKTEISGSRTALEWLEMRDGIAAELLNPVVRGDLARLAEWPGVSRRQAHNIIPEFGSLLPRCEIVLWEEDMWDAAISGSKVFEGTELNQADFLPRPPMVWMLDRGPILEPPNLGLDRPAQLLALHTMQCVWSQGDREQLHAVPSPVDGVMQGIGLCWIAILAPYLPEAWHQAGSELSTDDPAVRDPANWLPRVKLLPPLAYGSKILPYAAPLVAAQKFMQQEFVEHRAKPFQRQQSRYYQRKHPTHQATVTEIALRRKKYLYPDDHQPEAREFSVQFYTAGTWCTCRADRFKVAQYYRRGCWKGPEDAPVKPPGERIYHVRR